MITRYFGLFDLLIGVVPALGFGIWQLISINREITKDKAAKPSKSPEGAGHPVGEHRLDDR